MTEHSFETDRLLLSRLTVDDAPMMLELVNEPGWLKFIGDRKVHSVDEARAYLERGAIAMGLRTGFWQYRVTRKSDGENLGTCGLLKRDTLTDVDLGFAFFARHGKQGYAREAAAAVMAHGKRVHGLRRIVGITMAENVGSIRVLEGAGMVHEGKAPAAVSHEGEPPIELYAWNDRAST